MEDNILFGKGSLPHTPDHSGWTESQYYQLKAQIQAYKYLIRNLTLQPELIDKIRTYDNGEWEKTRVNLFEKIQDVYEKRFENQDLVRDILTSVDEGTGLLLQEENEGKRECAKALG